ncbi:MAG: sigma 54-interacting transcriptional regulator [Deltaproteobacteria bacterium]|nr:sigma 54-interacting transcriptional regulator [Deltaproteobacteria bacterium]
MVPRQKVGAYQLLRSLGAGGEGSVWLAHDAHGRPVALKWLTLDNAQDAARTEYAILAQLDHPGLPRAIDLLLQEGQPALILEYIEGVSIDRWWHGRPPAERLRSLAQLLGTLEFLHARGVVHRDLKTANVLVTEADEVKLVDFGLATKSQALQEAALGGSAGTIAPEVLMGEQATEAADLYAVGTLLYAAHYGAPPFTGNASEVLQAQLLGPPPHCAQDDTPLGQLITRLLAPAPKTRPPSAAETLAELERATEAGSLQGSEHLIARGLPTPELVGREDIIVRLQRALNHLNDDTAPTSNERLFHLEGAPGCGRSRLLREIGIRARLAGVHVIEELPPKSVTLSTWQQTDSSGLRAAMVAHLLDSLQREVTRPTLLLLDAIEDPMLAEGLSALSTAEIPQLMVCISGANASIRSRLRAFTTIEVTPLAPAEIGHLANSMLPTAWRCSQLTAPLFTISEGNPLLAVLSLRAAAEARLRGEIVDLSAALEAPKATLEARLHQGLTQRLANLTPENCELLALLALLPRPLLWEEAEQVLGHSALPWARPQREGLLTITAHQTLKLAGRALAPAMKRALPQRKLLALAEIVLERLALSAQHRALVAESAGSPHATARMLLEGARDARNHLELAIATQLYLATASKLSAENRPEGEPQRGHSSPDTLWCEVAQELVAVGSATGLHAEVATCLNSLLGSAPEAARVEVGLALADLHLHAGSFSSGLSVLDGLRGATHHLDALALTAARLRYFGGEKPDEVQELDVARQSNLPEVSLEAHHIGALVAMREGRLEQAEAVLDATLERRTETSALMRARLLNSRGLLHQRRSRFEDAQSCYEESLALAREAHHLPYEASFGMNLASVAQQRGDLLGAKRAYTESLRVAERFGGTQELARISHNLARLWAELGQWGHACAELERSLSLCRSLLMHSLGGYNQLLAAEIALERREVKTAREKLNEARECFARRDMDASTRCDLALVQGRIALEEHDAQGAAAALSEAQKSAIGIPALEFQSTLLAARTHLALGKKDKAAQSLLRAWRMAEQAQDGSTRIEVHQLLGRALRSSDSTTSELHAGQALTLLRERLATLPEDDRAAYAARPLNASVLAWAAPIAAAHAPQASSANEAPSEPLLHAILAINKELNAESKVGRLLERIVDHAVDLTGAERGFLLMQPRERGPLRIEVARNIDQETIAHKEFKISRSVAEEVLQSGRPTIAVNAMDDARFQHFLSVHKLKLRSVLCVPLRVGRRIRGALYLDNRFVARGFDESHLTLLESLAEQAGIALGNRELLDENARRERELEHQSEKLEQLNRQLAAALENQRLRLDELASLTREQQGELQAQYHFDNLVGRSAVMRELFRLMDRVRNTVASVLIHGESGTGKELVARALHHNGARADGPFIGVNCGAIPATLLDGELFGYVRGAFTGAERSHRGLFERADGGTLFLDELGELPLELQVKLLRVLQEKTFVRLGEEDERQSDFRLIAASNRNLSEMVDQGAFRQDLFYRVNVIRLEIPPLRDRPEDIPLLLAHLMQRHGGHKVTFTRAVLERLVAYGWPGNVRELENEVLRMLALGGEEITPNDLSAALVEGKALPRSVRTPTGPLKEVLARVEQEVVEAALMRCGRVVDAAQELGMSRVGLHKLMSRHGITRPRATKK